MDQHHKRHQEPNTSVVLLFAILSLSCLLFVPPATLAPAPASAPAPAPALGHEKPETRMRPSDSEPGANIDSTQKTNSSVHPPQNSLLVSVIYDLDQESAHDGENYEDHRQGQQARIIKGWGMGAGKIG